MSQSQKEGEKGNLLFGKDEIKTPAVCAPVIGKTVGKMKDRIDLAIEQEADVIELRIDKLENYENWKSLLNTELPKIVTNRTRREGGYFDGTEEERVDFLLDSISAGTSCVDIEFSTEREKRLKVLEKAEKNNTSTICSFHDFDKFPNTQNLLEKARHMVRKSDFVKVIGYAETLEDSLKSLEFLIEGSKIIKKPLISFSMGEKGQFTRLVSPLLGSPITYASIEEKTAPGQLNLEETKEILGKFWN